MERVQARRRYRGAKPYGTDFEPRSFGLTDPATRYRTVIVSTFPPLRDGIARYADQQARQLGPSVMTIGHPGSQADITLRLSGLWRPLRLLRVTRRDDRLMVHWHPLFFHGIGRLSRYLTWLSLASVARFRRMTVLVHEPTMLETPGEARPAHIFWRSVEEIWFHSEAELHQEVARFPGIRRQAVVVDHATHFMPAVDLEKAGARATLGLDDRVTHFLCIGFVGRHKGFDRAVRAFATLPTEAASLTIIGSTLYENPDAKDYVHDLGDLVRQTPRVRLRIEYVSDEMFDTWVKAVDAVVLPYREIASSSVLARARILGTPAIVSNVGALPEQTGPSDVVFDSDAALEEAMAACVANRDSMAGSKPSRTSVTTTQALDDASSAEARPFF